MPALGEGLALPGLGVGGLEQDGPAVGLSTAGTAVPGRASGSCGVDRGLTPLADTQRHGRGSSLGSAGFVTESGHETIVAVEPAFVVDPSGRGVAP